MGIRFLCPNGHKLNVKAFLAGKRGVCPDCGARFTIPQRSTGEAVPEMIKEASVKADAADLPVSSAGSPAPLTSASDPITAAPDAVWYVRPQAGGQYGPAAGDLMRQWLEEGRVAADSLVWRDGWPDWMAAGEVFATLGNGHSQAPGQIEIDFEAEPAGPVSAPLGVARRRRNSKSIVLWLLAAAVLLAILMVFLFMKSR